ncbi:MAG: hypothetical protein RLZZ126_1104 [Pseudomonadota bacterium]
MHRLQLHYTLAPGNTPPPTGVANPLMTLLRAVHDQGSISAAARSLGVSYRHVWGELKRWESELGSELIVWDKGQAARLAEFGSKLLWAERQAQARLAPQIEALRAGLEQSFAVAFDPQAHVVTLHASHDDALGLLREHGLRSPRGPLHLDIQFCGSVDAIRALNEGRCALAGFHAVDHPAPGSLAQRTYQPLLQPGLHKIIGFARRSQGLIVAKGNPLGLRSLADVARLKARFVNRAIGSGTRLLLDDMLEAQGMEASALSGYEQSEPSHAAIAQAVAAGSADVGLGLESTALAFHLDFVPLARERYHLVCLKTALDETPMANLRRALSQADWAHAIGQLAGYEPDHCGEVLSLREALPWWDFSRLKTRRT